MGRANHTLPLVTMTGATSIEKTWGGNQSNSINNLGVARVWG